MPDVVWIEAAELANIRGLGKGRDREVKESQILDLASFFDEKPTSMAQAPSGQDYPTGESGSGWDRERLFAFYEDGLIFEEGPIETANIEDMLRRDGKARALEQALTLPVRGANWSIQPGKDDKGELEFVTDALTRAPESGGMDVPIEVVIGQMTSAFLFKRSHFEKVFRADDDGKVRFGKLAYRPPTTCYLARRAEDAAFAGFMQWTWKGQAFIRVLIPAEKAFVYIHGAHRDPITGISDLDVSYNAYQSKQKIRFLWYQFLETQSAPRTLAHHNSNDVGEAGAFAKRLATLKGGGVVGLTMGQDAKVLESNGQGAAEYQAALAYLDSEMSESVLAGFLDLTSRSSGAAGGSGGRGSNALAKSMQEFFNTGRQGAMNEVAAAINQGIIADLIRLNFGKNASMPKFKFTVATEDDNSAATIGLLQAIATAPSVSVIPWGFIDLLIEKVADLLQMPVDQVHAALMDRDNDPTESPADTLAAQGAISPQSAQVHNAIGAAHALVTQNAALPAAPATVAPA
jgi:hypothetical protein